MKKIVIFVLIFLLLPVSAKAQQVPQSVGQMQLSFAPLVKKTGPAVVNIYAKVLVRRQMVNPLFADPFFNRFFGMQGVPGGIQEKLENALGSGVIVDKTGLIATNTHVVKDATEIVAVTSDGREFAAEKILVDEKTDLAILRIAPKGEELPWLELADSDSLQVGDLVLAIGNPFGVGQTVTSGIVSALTRTGVGGMSYSSFIQTDAAINPGNSGGALIDMSGKVVGINSMIFSKDGGSLGIGFAIPANMVKAVVEASRKGGKLVRPWTGIVGQPVTTDMIESLGLKRARGALITKVHPKGPAAKAGIQKGDVILTMDGRTIQDPEEMKFRLATMPIGTPVKLEVVRGGATIALTMVSETPIEDPARDESELKGVNPLAGAIVANISPAVAEQMGGLAEDSGVVVISANKGNGARLGLQPRDIILGINGKAVSSVTQLKAALKASPPDRRWQVQLQRGHQVLNLVVTI